MLMTYMYIPSDATLQKNMYGLGVKISMVFEILRHFLIKGEGTTMYSNDWHYSRCFLTQETRIYMVNGWQSQWFLKY
jgi:hypothetical protein